MEIRILGVKETYYGQRPGCHICDNWQNNRLNENIETYWNSRREENPTAKDYPTGVNLVNN